MVKEIFKEQNLTRENKKFVVKNATSKDVKYNVFFGDENLWTDCDCVEQNKKLMPCKHMFAVMENINGISWGSFCPQQKNSVFFKIDVEGIGIKEVVFTTKMTNLENYDNASTIPDAQGIFFEIPLSV